MDNGEWGYLWTLAIHSTGKLLLCDRNALGPGIRLYGTYNDDAPINNNLPIDVGLPPFDIVFVE